MTQLFFMDESGHDHKNMPYEVRGGFSIHVSKLWPFVQKMQGLEMECFGQRRHVEIKGSKLLDKRKFKWAAQDKDLDSMRRKSLCKEFFQNSGDPPRDQFTAYGQACLKMAQGIVDLLIDLDAVIFAVAIPRGIRFVGHPIIDWAISCARIRSFCSKGSFIYWRIKMNMA